MIKQLSDAINKNEDEAETKTEEAQENQQNAQLAESISLLTMLVEKMNAPKVKTGIATIGKDGQVELKVIEG